MSGSTFGNIFKVTTWGESHGKAIGVVIDGCPAGVKISEENIQKDLDRRKPGKSNFASKRKESDKVEILSGVFNGISTGTPISLMVFNEDSISKDYSDIKDVYRPGHADYCYDQKYGFRDYRGGGRASGRETVARVIAGSIAKEVLSELNISFLTYTSSIGAIEVDKENIKENEIFENDFFIPCNSTAKKVEDFLIELMKEKDSVGGTVTCNIYGLKAGIGEPVFDKLDASLSKAILSIGATKGIEFGLGFKSSKICGHSNNDSFYVKDNMVLKNTNNSGGILGGISDGSNINFKVAFKPTPSIFKTQDTVNSLNENIKINIKGRHDPVVVPRAVIVVEAMAAITILDYLLINLTRRIDNIKSLYLK